MTQLADVRPDPTYQRKAAIAGGAAQDHRGRVQIRPIHDFDLNRTIFQTLEGKAQRYIVWARVAKDVRWSDEAEQQVQAAYDAACQERPLPEVPRDVLDFLVEECDFDVEHADGSFLDHLYFCFEYAVHHYPDQSPLPALLHSILGAGTNTFPMGPEKIPALRALLSDSDWRQIEAFPSVLRLKYHGPMRRELWANIDQLHKLKSVRMHRVIDNESIEMSGEDFFVALNYQLIHLIDFLPTANWSVHQNDTSFIIFRDLYDLLSKGGQLNAQVGYTPAEPGRRLEGEELPGFLAAMATRIPVGLAEKLASKSIARFSQKIGHSLDYTMTWED